MQTDLAQWYTLEIVTGLSIHRYRLSRFLFQTEREAVKAGIGMLAAQHVEVRIWKGATDDPPGGGAWIDGDDLAD